MHRLLLIALIACNSASGSKLDEKPVAKRNLICERVTNPKMTCTPEMSGEGQLHTHSARVTSDKVTMACALHAASPITMECGPLQVVPEQKAEEAKQDEAAKAETKTKVEAKPGAAKVTKK